MKTFLTIFVGFAVTASVVASARAPSIRTQAAPAKPASSTKLPASVKAPPAIASAFKKAYPNATIKSVSREKENGREQFEVESVENGMTRDLIYLADGSVVEVEDEVGAADFPAAVTAAIKARYPTATITKRERLTITEGHVVEYEATMTGAKVKAVALTPEGKWVSPK